jgi:surfeit locus 1 family protein
MFKRLGQLGRHSLGQQCNTQYKLAIRQSTKRLLSTETENAAAEPVLKETYRAKQRKFGLGTALLCTIPFFTFGLGTWQVQRLRWKVNYIATLEDRLHREAIPLPRRIK